MIINRYIAKEVLATLLAVMAVLLLIFFSNRFIVYLADASAGRLSSDLVLQLIAIKTVGSLVILLPLALFLSVLLALSRMYKDNEMVALAACGVSVKQVYKSILLMALLVAAIVAAVSLYLAPLAEEQSYRVRDAQQSKYGLIGIASGRFTEMQGGDGVMYVERLTDDGKTMENVFVQSQRSNKHTVLAAHRGYQYIDQRNGDKFLVMVDGYRYDGVPGSGDLKVVKYREHAVRLQDKSAPSERRMQATPTRALIQSGRRADVAELQWRISMPLTVILLAFLAVPLSRTNPRQGKYARLFVAVLVYLIYNNLLGVAHTWVARGVLPPAVGLWPVHIGMVLTVWMLLARQYGGVWLARAVLRRS